MRFSSMKIGGIVLLCTVFLFGCSNIGIGDKTKKKEDVPTEQSDPVGAKGGVEGAMPAFVAIPNPYQPGSVPGPAKLEYQKIKGLMAAKKWKESLGLLNLMTETYPKLSGPYVNLGIVYQKLGEPKKAEKAFKFAIETNSKNFDAYTQLGVLYRELGRFPDAETIYKNALSIWPHHLASTKNLGILYDLYMGRFEEAMSYYELSLNIAGGEDRQLKGWIADLKRRMSSK